MMGLSFRLTVTTPPFWLILTFSNKPVAISAFRLSSAFCPS
jgi:hypothetical protein